MTPALCRIIEMVRSKDQGGLLNNLYGDFLYDRRREDDEVTAARYGSALLRLRRLARGHDVPIDRDVEEAADKFASWVETNQR